MWEVGHRRDGAAALHAAELGARVPAVWRLLPTRPALVLGSAQSEAQVDVDRAKRRGIEVIRRRSGGGAVLLDPAGSVWVDVVIGRDDPRWDDDVSRSARWLGRLWADALGEGAAIHTGPLRDRERGRVICFAGLADGEVTVDGRKAVGISQRRDRRGARFQCVVHASWDGAAIAELMAPALGSADAVAEMGRHLRTGVVAVPAAEVVADRVVDALRRLDH